jgi:hypothetical protein
MVSASINLGNCKKLLSTKIQPEKLTQSGVDISYNGPDYEKILAIRWSLSKAKNYFVTVCFYILGRNI